LPLESQISTEDFEALRRVLFGEMLEENDVERWEQQSFEFCEGEGPLWGLKQRHGGPCGVLAAVQGFLLCEVFGELKRDARGLSNDVSSTAGGDGVQDGARMFAVLARALTTMLTNALPEGTSTFRLVKWRSALQVSEVDPAASRVSSVTLPDVHAVNRWLAADDGKQLRQPGAVLSFVASLLLTRGLATVQEDMDDAGQHMITTFGHCSQELMNLCITGKSTSNVHDGNISLGDDGEDCIVLKGVEQPPAIGYLSAFEALNQLEVGRCYKQPKWPIWVIGGPMHYTICFSADCSLNHVKLPPRKEDSDDQVNRSIAPAFEKCGVCGVVLSEDAAISSVGQLQDGCGELHHFNGLEQVAGTGESIRSPELRTFKVVETADGQQACTVASNDEDPELFQILLRSRWHSVETRGDANAQGSNEPPRLN